MAGFLLLGERVEAQHDARLETCNGVLFHHTFGHGLVELLAKRFGELCGFGDVLGRDGFAERHAQRLDFRFNRTVADGAFNRFTDRFLGVLLNRHKCSISTLSVLNK